MHNNPDDQTTPPPDQAQPTGGVDGDDKHDTARRDDAPSTGASKPTKARAAATGTRERVPVGSRVKIYRDRAVSPNWNIQYNLDGAQVRRSLGTSKKEEALRVARRKDAQLVLGQAGQPAPKPVTVAAAVEQYLA